MNTLQKCTYYRLIAALLLCTFVFGGCVPRSQSPKATTAAPFQKEAPSSSALSEEKAEIAQQEFDQFTEAVFLDNVSSSQLDLHFFLKDPAAYGITGAKSLFGSVSQEDAILTTAEIKDLKQQLEEFDIRLLTEDQKLTMRVLQSYLNTQLMADGLELYAQPLAPTIGVQAQLPVLLAEYEFRNRQDVDTYLQLLGEIDEYYGAILKLEQIQADAGLMMSDSSIDRVIESCQSYLLVPDNNFMIDTFHTRLDAIPDLTEEERATYQQQNALVLERDFVAAYQLLIDGMTALKGTSTNEGGLAGLPKGKDYFRYLVYDSTGTSYATIDDLLVAMEDLVDKNLKKTTALTKQNPALLDEFDTYQFRQTEPDAMLEELKNFCGNDFPSLPECNYSLKYVPSSLELSLSPAFYVTPPIDDFTNNTIYINQRFDSEDLYTTIAHEGYPGHLYQTVYTRANNTCNLRQLLSFTGHSEGWATYVEHYAYTLDNGLSSEMGQLLSANTIASLGIQACLDVYINYYGWTKEQVSDYLSNYFGDSGDTVDEIYNTMIENPSNYMAYYVGYMEFQNMLEIAKKQLGSKFDLKEFHRFLLDLGSAPFDVVQPYFASWVMEQKM